VAARALRGFAGMQETTLEQRCEDLFRSVVLAHVCEAGRTAVDDHRARGDVVAIVTGATP
jgi:phosphoserine phosphatase